LLRVLGSRQAIEEIHRLSGLGAKLLFTPYSDRHSSCIGREKNEDELVDNISAGTLVAAGQICFSGRGDVERALANGWTGLAERN
jgi:hypothetical protein